MAKSLMMDDELHGGSSRPFSAEGGIASDNALAVSAMRWPFM
jgi:hypothetical protein